MFQNLDQNDDLDQIQANLFHNHPQSWSSPVATPTCIHYVDQRSSWVALNDEQMNQGPPEGPQDPAFVDSALQRLREVAPAALAGDQPFFLAVGTIQPHAPFKFPERFLEFYPEEDISEPDNGYAPYDMPDIAWDNFNMLRGTADIVALEIPNLGSVNVTLPAQKVPI